MASDSDCIVIGAGISGLSAAKLLTESGLECIVLEARDRVGGRTYTKKDPKVKYVDLGGSYVGPTQEPILRIAKEFGINNYKVNEIEDLVLYNDGSRIRFRPTKFPTFFNPFVNMDIYNFFSKIDEMGEEIPVDAPWKAPHADLWDTMTYKEFMDKTLWTKNGRKVAELFINLVVTSGSYEASLLWLLWYVKQCGGVDRIFSTTNGGQERKLIGGSQQISEKMAEQLGSDKVKLNQPVIEIKQEDTIVTVKTLDGSEYTAKYIISAVPPHLLMKMHFHPPLPPLKNQLIQRMPMGTVIKCIMYYQTPFWRKLGYCGSSVLLESDPLDYSLSYTLDDTKPDGTFPAIIGFILADKARHLISASKEERCQRICNSIARVFGSNEALNPLHYEEHSWLSEQYSGGCYTSMCPPGLLTRYGKVLRDPFMNMFFAGTETATAWSGYMSGAVQAGERAAREVLSIWGKIRPDEIWNVHEPKCEEVPARPFEHTFMEKHMPSIPQFLKFVGFSAILGTYFALWKCDKLHCPFLENVLKNIIEKK